MIGLIDVSYAISILVLVVLGLSIIFGMLRFINMAHGEKIMLGAYCVYLTQQLPFPVYINMLIGILLAIATTASVGAIMYLLIIRHLKLRLLDSILATWGVAVILKKLVSIFFGAGGKYVSSPIDTTIILFGSSYPVYRLLFIFVSLSSLLLLYLLFFKSHFGIQARAVMSNPLLASSIGIERGRMNLYSFMIGAGAAGFAGAMIAPLISISPLMGEDYLVPAFLSVLVGGLGSIAAPIMGAGVIAGVESSVSILSDAVIAQIAMLSVAIILLKAFPDGMFTKKK